MNLDRLKTLITILETGSTQGAAEALGISRPTANRRLRYLEEELGTPLVISNHQGTSPTLAGNTLAEEGRLILYEWDALMRSLRPAETSLRTPMHFLLPSGMPMLLMVIIIMQLRERLPLANINYTIVDDPAAWNHDAFDIVMQWANRPMDGNWHTWRTAQAREVLLATPKYLERHGTPQTLEELRQHALLLWCHPTRNRPAIPLRDGGNVEVAPRLIMADVYCLRRAALRGQGIALVPEGGLVEPGVPNETLVQIMPELVGRPIMSIVSHRSAQARDPKIVALIEILTTLLPTAGLAPPLRIDRNP